MSLALFWSTSDRQLPFSFVTVIRLGLFWTNTFQFFSKFCHTNPSLRRLRSLTPATRQCSLPVLGLVTRHPLSLGTHDISIDFGVHFHSSPLHWVTLFFVLRVILAQINTLFTVSSLVWPVTHAHCLVHLGNVSRRIRLLPLLASPHSEASSSQLLLFADRAKLCSRYSHVVLLDRASCRALVSGLALCLLHSEAPIFGLQCRGLMPSTRIVSPCFTRPRFQLGLSSRAPPDSTKRDRSTWSI